MVSNTLFSQYPILDRPIFLDNNWDRTINIKLHEYYITYYYIMGYVHEKWDI
jgi:hypothetical protein